jgi:hypothetical protein
LADREFRFLQQYWSAWPNSAHGVNEIVRTDSESIRFVLLITVSFHVRSFLMLSVLHLSLLLVGSMSFADPGADVQSAAAFGKLASCGCPTCILAGCDCQSCDCPDCRCPACSYSGASACSLTTCSADCGCVACDCSSCETGTCVCDACECCPATAAASVLAATAVVR